jgi:hypothetical protein
MQKKNEHAYCVGCEDTDIQALMKKNPESTAQMQQSSQLTSTISQPTNSSRSSQISHDVVRESAIKTDTNDSDLRSSYETLRSKITWATRELENSNNLTYTVELCNMIKSAAEAIKSLKDI